MQSLPATNRLLEHSFAWATSNFQRLAILRVTSLAGGLTPTIVRLLARDWPCTRRVIAACAPYTLTHAHRCTPVRPTHRGTKCQTWLIVASGRHRLPSSVAVAPRTIGGRSCEVDYKPPSAHACFNNQAMDRRVTFASTEAAVPELTALTKARMRPAAPMKAGWLPGRAEYATSSTTSWDPTLEGYESYPSRMRRRRARKRFTRNCWCCGSPDQASLQPVAERKPSRTSAPVVDETQSSARCPEPAALPRRDVTPLPRLKAQSHSDLKTDSDDTDEYFSCSDDDENSDGTTTTLTCCPPEHVGKLSQMEALFGAQTPSPVAHTLWRFLCARKYDFDKACQSFQQHLEWRRSKSIPTEVYVCSITARAALRSRWMCSSYRSKRLNEEFEWYSNT